MGEMERKSKKLVGLFFFRHPPFSVSSASFFSIIPEVLRNICQPQARMYMKHDINMVIYAFIVFS
jgi:hypothetical protein